MANAKKIALVKQLTEKISQSKAVYLLSYQGLTHRELERLRTQLQEINAQLIIIKNRLFLRAVNNAYPQKDTEPELSGPTAALFTFEDEITPLSVIKKFALDKKLPQFKIGFLGSKLLNQNEVIRLAGFPSKKFIHIQLVNTIASPLSCLNSVLIANIRNLIILISYRIKS